MTCRSDVEEGGETVFPASTGNFSTAPGWNEMSECAKRGLSVKPKMGAALLFWSMRPDATLDPSSLHGKVPPSSRFSTHPLSPLLSQPLPWLHKERRYNQIRDSQNKAESHVVKLDKILILKTDANIHFVVVSVDIMLIFQRLSC